MRTSQLKMMVMVLVLGVAVAMPASAARLPAEPAVHAYVQVSRQGQATVRGGVVTSIDRSTITLTVQWGSSLQTWTVTTDDDTTIIRSRNDPADFGELAVGDVVQVTGRVDQSASTPTIRARMIKDWSIVHRQLVLRGRVEQVDATEHRFTVRLPDGTAAIINASNETEYRRGNEHILFSDIHLNDIVVAARGDYHTNGKTLDATHIRLAKESATPGPTIMAVQLLEVTNTSAKIHWATDVPATSRIYYSTTSPVDLATASSVSSATLTSSPTLTLTGLAPDTTYYAVIESTDSAGHRSRTTAEELAFHTNASFAR